MGVRVLTKWVGVGVCKMGWGKGQVIGHHRACAPFDHTGMAVARPVRSALLKRTVVAPSARCVPMEGLMGDKGLFVC